MAAGAKGTLERTRPGRPRLLAFVALAVVGALALAAIVAARTGLFRGPSNTLHGLPFDPPQPAPDFVLTNQDNQAVRLSDQRGKVILLYFGFTHCPDACPTTLAIWKQVHALLGTDAEQASFVFLSVDPRRDSPERLKEYLANFNPAFVGLTGSPEAIDDVALAYLAFKYPDPAIEAHEHGDEAPAELSPAAYQVYHSALTHVIDRTGQLVLAFRYQTNAQDIADDVRRLLEQ